MRGREIGGATGAPRGGAGAEAEEPVWRAGGGGGEEDEEGGREAPRRGLRVRAARRSGRSRNFDTGGGLGLWLTGAGDDRSTRDWAGTVRAVRSKRTRWSSARE